MQMQGGTKVGCAEAGKAERAGGMLEDKREAGVELCLPVYRIPPIHQLYQTIPFQQMSKARSAQADSQRRPAVLCQLIRLEKTHCRASQSGKSQRLSQPPGNGCRVGSRLRGREPRFGAHGCVLSEIDVFDELQQSHSQKPWPKP